MPFAVDADVVVLSLRKTGRVVEAARNGRYRVRVGGVVMQCREDDLQEANADGAKKRKPSHRPESAAGRSTTVSHSSAERRRLASLDLHGFTVEEALSKVEERIDLALRTGLESLEIIHGRSSGRIKAAVHRLLRELTAVRHFEVLPDNPGATRVCF